MSIKINLGLKEIASKSMLFNTSMSVSMATIEKSLMDFGLDLSLHTFTTKRR